MCTLRHLSTFGQAVSHIAVKHPLRVMLYLMQFKLSVRHPSMHKWRHEYKREVHETAEEHEVYLLEQRRNSRRLYYYRYVFTILVTQCAAITLIIFIS